MRKNCKRQCKYRDIAQLEHNRFGDHLVFGNDMPSIGKTIQPVVLLGIIEIEDIGLVERDIAYYGTVTLQRVAIRQLARQRRRREQCCKQYFGGVIDEPELTPSPSHSRDQRAANWRGAKRFSVSLRR